MYLCVMDLTLETFVRNAKRLGLCDEYSAKISKAGSKKSLIDIALDANGLDYVANNIARGNGLTADYIFDKFGMFNNGRYIRKKDGYSSVMYCREDKPTIEITTTAALIIDYKGTVNIPSNHGCELYVVNSNIAINGTGRCLAYMYNSTIEKPDLSRVLISEKYNDGV